MPGSDVSRLGNKCYYSIFWESKNHAQQGITSCKTDVFEAFHPPRSYFPGRARCTSSIIPNSITWHNDTRSHAHSRSRRWNFSSVSRCRDDRILLEIYMIVYMIIACRCNTVIFARSVSYRVIKIDTRFSVIPCAAQSPSAYPSINVGQRRTVMTKENRYFLQITKNCITEYRH